MSAWVHEWYRGGFVNIYEAGVGPWWVIADTRPFRFSLYEATSPRAAALQTHMMPRHVLQVPTPLGPWDTAFYCDAEDRDAVVEGARFVDAFARLLLAALPHWYETQAQAVARAERVRAYFARRR